MSQESKAIRAFVAIELPAEVRSRLHDTQVELRAILPRHSAAWPKSENLHLTLRFLGNISETQVPQLQSKLSQKVIGFGALDLICERLGCFPDLRYPRVVWAGVQEASGRLQTLHQRTDEAARDFAETPAESRFVGHITLARPKQIKRPDAERLARFVETAVSRKFGEWQAHEVLLLRSELTDRGAKYHELARVSLA